MSIIKKFDLKDNLNSHSFINIFTDSLKNKFIT